ncbi:hypothetical protein J25TS5_04540 [Paenibacillus faecis]|uniref:hypothetical protein n=1 Tax=Paenibacillus faecis TaxID=862114 RepID=UPI001B0DC78F|nr:hypothetical protein [Paenibacillus faecis]GIO83522.1 hypothetical protein J25TS5_04540 [Paenibacillus faecis]
MNIYKELYRRQYINELINNFIFDEADFDFETHKKLIYWGVKALGRESAKPQSLEEAYINFNARSVLMDWIGLLTPSQLITLFPIAKDYDGHKYQTKDYFYTMDVCIKHGLDTKIGDAFEFLWDYQNWDISHFVIEYLSTISDVRKFTGNPSLVEEFAAKNGLKTYQMKEMNGSTVLVENLVITKDGRVL